MTKTFVAHPFTTTVICDSIELLLLLRPRTPPFGIRLK